MLKCRSFPLLLLQTLMDVDNVFRAQRVPCVYSNLATSAMLTPLNDGGLHVPKRWVILVHYVTLIHLCKFKFDGLK